MHQFTKLSDIYLTAFPAGLSHEIETLHKIQVNWSMLVGKMLAQHTAPYSLINKKLTVLVEDSAYVVQLNQLQKNIRALLRVLLKDHKAVSSIRFMVGEYNHFQPAIKVQHHKKQQQLTAQEDEQIQKLLSVISDDRLRSTFARLLKNRLLQQKHNCSDEGQVDS